LPTFHNATAIMSGEQSNAGEKACRPKLRVAIAGFGAIGAAVAGRLDKGIDGLRLSAVSARDRAKAERRLREFREPVPVMALGELAMQGDVVVECAPAAVFLDVARPTLEAGRILMPLSVGALLAHPELVDLARERGGRILVPTGALIGLDAVRAAAEGTIRSVKMVTRKPPKGLAGAPYLVAKGISLEGLNGPVKVFAGTAREGARGFPANVNVAAALSLAGIGPDRTMLEIWADPTLERNTHRIEVEADSANFTMTIENVPSDENPRTGRITALSAIAALRGLVSPLRIGT
jgi:aspartate dehydrogenase